MKFNSTQESLAYCQILIDDYIFCKNTHNYQKGKFACQTLIEFYVDQEYYQLANEIRFDLITMCRELNDISTVYETMDLIFNDISKYFFYVLNCEEDEEMRQRSIKYTNEEKYPHYLELATNYEMVGNLIKAKECLLLALKVAKKEDRVVIAKKLIIITKKQEHNDKGLLKKYLDSKEYKEIIKVPESSSLYNDPIEQTPTYLKIAKELEQRIIDQIGGNNGMGYCHLYWRTKKQMLKDYYNIDWLSPADLNKTTYFD